MLNLCWFLNILLYFYWILTYFGSQFSSHFDLLMCLSYEQYVTERVHLTVTYCSFSWTIYVLRTILGLRTLPTMHPSYDLYLHHRNCSINKSCHIWNVISWSSLQQAASLMQSEIARKGSTMNTYRF
jgi:hypothetical protein